MAGTVRNAPWLGLTMVACFIFTGHDSMNARCEYRALDDWRQVLSNCPFYVKGRDLASWGLMGGIGLMDR